MKKIFVILFAMSALSLLLAGCKKDEAAADNTGAAPGGAAPAEPAAK